MVVGVLELRLVVPESLSLKDKRRVVRSLKDRIRNEFNVSIAEVGALDDRKIAVLAAAQISNDARYVNGTLDRIVNFVRRHGAAQLVDYEIEMR